MAGLSMKQEIVRLKKENKGLRLELKESRGLTKHVRENFHQMIVNPIPSKADEAARSRCKVRRQARGSKKPGTGR